MFRKFYFPTTQGSDWWVPVLNVPYLMFGGKWTEEQTDTDLQANRNIICLPGRWNNSRIIGRSLVLMKSQHHELVAENFMHKLQGSWVTKTPLNLWTRAPRLKGMFTGTQQKNSFASCLFEKINVQGEQILTKVCGSTRGRARSGGINGWIMPSLTLQRAA